MTGLIEVTADVSKAERMVGSGYEVVFAHFIEGFADRVESLDGVSGYQSNLWGRFGIGIAYGFIDSTGDYRVVPDERYARCVGTGDVEPVWVVYRDGYIDHEADAEEFWRELESRIRERISEGVTPEHLLEFNRFRDLYDMICWLEEYRPDYREVIDRTVSEMMQARVLVGVDEVARRLSDYGFVDWTHGASRFFLGRVSSVST